MSLPNSAFHKMKFTRLAIMYSVAALFALCCVRASPSLDVPESVDVDNLDKRDAVAYCFDHEQCAGNSADIQWNSQVDCPSIYLLNPATVCTNCYSQSGCVNYQKVQCISSHTAGCLHPI